MFYSACTANGNECADIPNTSCNEDKCTCVQGYELETAAGETKDSCKGKITLDSITFTDNITTKITFLSFKLEKRHF